VTLDEARRKRLVDGHDRTGRVVPHWDSAAALAGVGALRSSIADMARFAEALAGRRETPLEAAIELAMKPIRGAQGGMIGLAWHQRGTGTGPALTWHNGATAGFASNLAVDRRGHRAAVVLVNTASSFDDLAFHLLDEGVPLRKKRIAIDLEPAALQEYVGRYQLSPTFSIAFFLRDGKLMTQGTGQAAVEVFAEAKDRLFLRVVDAQMEFVRDAEGRIAAMNLRQGGRTVQSRKVSDQP
jgi:CubicO group peptidase (beta-lactamase class C family)